jgi:hypothetical protein
MPVLRVLAVPNLQLNDPHHAAQMHPLALAVMRLSSAEGENPAVAVGRFLEPLLQAPSRPFAAFFQHFHLDLAQAAHWLIVRVHNPFQV